LKTSERIYGERRQERGRSTHVAAESVERGEKWEKKVKLRNGDGERKDQRKRECAFPSTKEKVTKENGVVTNRAEQIKNRVLIHG
jgi:hypothetical protein